MSKAQVHKLISVTLESGGMSKEKANQGADILSRFLKLKPRKQGDSNE